MKYSATGRVARCTTHQAGFAQNLTLTQNCPIRRKKPLHCWPTNCARPATRSPSGSAAGLTSVDVTLIGIGGHGAQPQNGKDPIVMAGEFIVQLQTITIRCLPRELRAALVSALGTAMFSMKIQLASEDFELFGLANHKIPTVIFWLGAMDPTMLAAAEKAGTFLPGPHTSRFEPIPEPTLRTGVKAMTSGGHRASATVKPVNS